MCEACCLRFSGEAAQLRRYSSALYGCLLPADKTPSRSCFVGNDAEFPDDTGFALKCWVKVSYDNNAAENGAPSVLLVCDSETGRSLSRSVVVVTAMRMNGAQSH